MLTIGEVARLSGTTVRAVRHYHATGVLPEPGRDASGYRRYGAEALVRLVRVRQLRDLGVPLLRIRSVLDSHESFEAVLDALDAELAARAAEIAEQRAGIAAARARQAEPELPAPLGELFHELATKYSDLREVAQRPEEAAGEKDLLLLLLALAPETFDELVEVYRRLLADPDLLARLYELDRGFAALAGEPVDSPAVEELVDALFSDPDFAAELEATDPADMATPATVAMLTEYLGNCYRPAQQRFVKVFLARAQEYLRRKAST